MNAELVRILATDAQYFSQQLRQMVLFNPIQVLSSDEEAIAGATWSVNKSDGTLFATKTITIDGATGNVTSVT